MRRSFLIAAAAAAVVGGTFGVLTELERQEQRELYRQGVADHSVRYRRWLEGDSSVDALELQKEFQRWSEFELRGFDLNLVSASTRAMIEAAKADAGSSSSQDGGR